MSSALAGETCRELKARTRCTFITGHREFPDQGINTSSLFMRVWGGVWGWKPLGAVLEDSCTLHPLWPWP